MFEILPFDFYDRKNILEWYNLRKEIDFDPSYQRSSYSVWTKGLKQKLIDSIINEFDIPKFYFHLLEYGNKINKSDRKFAIIDGKQRLLSIFEFIEGEYKLSQDFVYYKDRNKQLSGLGYKDLLVMYPEMAYKLQSFILDIVFVVTDEVQMIEIFFSRLNSGKPLNNAEKRQAVIGFINNEIRSLVKNHSFFIDKVSFSNARNAHNDIVAKLLIIEQNHDFLTMEKEVMDNLYYENREENSQNKKLLHEVNRVLDLMVNVFNDRDELLRSKSSIPVYYWFIKNHITECSKQEELKKIREFLASLEGIRRNSSDPRLLEYNKYQEKSTDKRKSMFERYNILEHYYQKYQME